MSALHLVPNKDAGPDPDSGSGRGGDGLEGRLRQLELQMVRLETRLESIPTKEDLESIKTLIAEKEATNTRWMITVLSGALVAIVVALIRTFMA